jgi:FSR family fosmidomycin resistance protein-like MFS transporter
MTSSASAAAHHSVRHDTQVIALVGVAHATSHFFHLIVAPLFPWLKLAFGLSYAELGLVMTAFFVVSGVGQALSGFLVDRIGAYPVLLAGLALCSVAALLLCIAGSYPMLLLGAAVAGAGNAVFHPADFTLLSRQVSPARVAHAFSVHGISGNIGWGAAPLFMVGLTSAFDWRTALFCAAIIPVVVIAVLAAFRRVLDRPAPVQAAAAARNSGARAEPLLGFMRLPAVWMCFAFFMITAVSLSGVQVFAPAALHEIYETPLTLASAAITVFMVFSAVGMVVGGFIAARASHHERIIAVAFLVAAACALALGSGATPAMAIWVPIAVMGFASGIAGPSRDLLVRAAAPRNATGRVYGVVYSGLDIGISIGPFMFGALMDAHHPGWVFVLVGLFQAAALLTAIGVGQRTTRHLATT